MRRYYDENTPVYRYSAKYAREHGELDAYRASDKANIAKVNNLKEQARLMVYLENHDINTVSYLTEHISKVNETGAPVQRQFSGLREKLKALDGLEKAGERYTRTKPIYDEWYGILFKKSKEKYAAEHKKELNTFHLTKKKLAESHYLDKDGNFDFNKLNRDRDKIVRETERFSEEHKPLREQAETLTAIRKAISSVRKDDIFEEQKTKETERQTKSGKNRKKEEHSLE
ncbi:MAG: DUF3849 domain-containing protein [Eubacteriales bacterium]